MHALIPTRPHVRRTEQVMMLIGPSTCWHFDAWLLALGGELFAVIETRAGGRELLTRNTYKVMGGGLHYVAAIPDGAEFITLQDKALWPRFAELNEIHWRWIVPMTLRVPGGYRSRSVALNYVRAPSIEPFDGTEVNMTHATE